MLVAALRIEYIRVRGVEDRGILTLCFEIHGSLLSQVSLQHDSILGVRAEQGVCNISEERDKSNAEVDNDIEHHLRLDGCWQTIFNLRARPVHHESHENINNIPNTRERSR